MELENQILLIVRGNQRMQQHLKNCNLIRVGQYIIARLQNGKYLIEEFPDAEPHMSYKVGDPLVEAIPYIGFQMDTSDANWGCGRKVFFDAIKNEEFIPEGDWETVTEEAKESSRKANAMRRMKLLFEAEDDTNRMPTFADRSANKTQPRWPGRFGPDYFRENDQDDDDDYDDRFLGNPEPVH